jgi:hypothetical protein
MEFFSGALSAASADGPSVDWNSAGAAQPLLQLKHRVRVPQALTSSADHYLVVLDSDGFSIIVSYRLLARTILINVMYRLFFWNVDYCMISISMLRV